MMCPYFFVLKERYFTMRKLKMKATKGLAFEEGCNKHLEYYRQRNLRQGIINHYRQSCIFHTQLCFLAYSIGVSPTSRLNIREKYCGS